MPRSKSPRKAHRPRFLRTPMMPDTVAVLIRSARHCETMLRLGRAESDEYNAIGDLFDTVGLLISNRTADDHPDAIALLSARLSMRAARDRYRGGLVRMNPTDIDQVQRGLAVIIARVTDFSVEDIFLADQRMQAERRAAREDSRIQKRAQEPPLAISST